MRLTVPAEFNLWSTIHSHGWSALPPFRIDDAKGSLHFLVRSSRSALIPVEVLQPSRGALIVRTEASLSQTRRAEVLRVVRSCLRLGEDLSEFHARARKSRQYRWVHAHGAGRMLRSPTMFEDVLKMLCTTNCSWSLTKVMVGNLCAVYGDRTKTGAYAFPLPGAIAGASEAHIRKHIRAGYRSPYILELSRKVARNELDLESWRTSDRSTPELFEQIRSVKGVGPYAAGNLLKLVGRYDVLGIDSWCRNRYAEAFHGGRKVSDRTIERRYPAADPWRGLFFWMDMT